jgi:hypothetical protein
MFKTTRQKICFFFLPFLLGLNSTAQNKISIDLAAIRHIRKELNGINLSCFYHFNERITGGLEMNRFFPILRKEGEEMIELSAWDFDLNFHFLVPLNKNLKLYPLTGISHTSEREQDNITKVGSYERFWSYNTGAGILWEKGRWAPHVEYSFTWGHLNQQFLLAGISYEIEWGHRDSRENGNQ